MDFDADAAEALRIAGDFDVQDFYPAPFPEDVPIIELEKLSLAKLLNDDEAEAQRLLNACSTSGFFYLDMLDHATGRRLWRSACNIRRLGQTLLASTPMEKKLQFKPLEGVRVFDRGYLVRNADQRGQSADLEIVNVPQSEFFGTKIEGCGIPDWLLEHEGVWKEALECENTISRAVLSVLEKQLQLRTGTITKLHRLTDNSGDFVRLIKYAGAPSDKDVPEGFPPHKDATTITMVFTWLGGLQVLDPSVEVENFAIDEKDWRWVRPEPGYATVNLGDGMAIFTNKLLKSVTHRVIKAPGLQRPHNRFSVVLSTRPENNTLMRPFESPVIAQVEQEDQPMTSAEWGYRVVSGIKKRGVERGARDLDNA